MYAVTSSSCKGPAMATCLWTNVLVDFEVAHRQKGGSVQLSCRPHRPLRDVAHGQKAEACNCCGLTPAADLTKCCTAYLPKRFLVACQ